MNHPLSPPYVPPEYRKCKHSEMPEPYKSDIDAWIKRVDEHYESVLKKHFLISRIYVPSIFAIILLITGLWFFI